MSGAAQAKPHNKGLPPGLAKKMDCKTFETNEVQYAHPSLKGLHNALQHGNKNNRARNVLRQKIINRGGEELLENRQGVTIGINGEPTTLLEPGQEVKDLAFKIKDNEGNLIDLQDNYQIEIQIDDSNNILEKPEDGMDLTARDMSDKTGVTRAVYAKASEENSGTAIVNAVLYKDKGNDLNNEVDEGEEIGAVNVEYTVEEPAVTTGVFNSDDLNIFNANEKSIMIAPEDEPVELDYKILDQFKNSIELSEDTAIEWTVKNTGDEDIIITKDEDSFYLLEPNEEQSFTRTAAEDSSSCTITFEANDPTAANITANIIDNDESLQSTSICFLPEENILVSDSGEKINGKVEAIEQNEDEETMDMLVSNSEDIYLLDDIAYETNIFSDVENIKTGYSVEVDLDNLKEEDKDDSDFIRVFNNN